MEVGREANEHSSDDGLSDDALDSFEPPVMPPIPELSNLGEIEHAIGTTSQSAQGRDMLTKFLLGEDYIRKLLPLIEMAEDLEALQELHRLNKIMKMFILLNDNQVVEYMVSEEMVMGVLAALECAYWLLCAWFTQADKVQMTPNSQTTRRTTENTSRTSPGSRRLYQSNHPRSRRRFT